MTSTSVELRARTTAHPVVPLLLVAGFAAAVAVRVSYAGPAGAASVRAGLVFAALLLVLSGCAGARTRLDRRAIALGAVGMLVLVAPALAVHGGTFAASRTITGYPGWAVATTIVATAEEAFLRGALFDALRRFGVGAAVVVAAVAFAALHVPLYGWHIVPLDLAVGLFLGALRVVTGGWAAPAIAHAGADLVGWWLA